MNQRVFILASLTAFISLFYSCSKENPDSSEVANLIKTLKLQNPGCTCDPYLDQYSWRNETVYVLLYGGPACDWFPTFYTAKGQKFTLSPGYSFDDFIQESVFTKSVWSCK